MTIDLDSLLSRLNIKVIFIQWLSAERAMVAPRAAEVAGAVRAADKRDVQDESDGDDHSSRCARRPRVQPKPDEEKMSYPNAEWDKAGMILMHTPGLELFNGVIHPAAGLFEDYFDVDLAAEEHRGYIRMLENNGIRVYTVGDILGEVGIDSLRVLADKVLNYSPMPGEDILVTEAYRQEILSKMSRNDLIRCILLQPSVRLSRTDNNTGYEAQYIQKPLMNLYFTRDQSITTPRGHVICRMNSTQRFPETDIIELCYEHLGLKPILRIGDSGRLEGGDYIPAGAASFIGCGMRTNDEGIRQMMEADAFGHDTVVVVRDHKFWQMQMHLDTYFNVIDRDLCTMVTSRLNAKPGEPEFVTCDIWTRKPGTKSYSLVESGLSFVEYLRGCGFEMRCTMPTTS